jgi:hypothetical protein
MGERDGQERAVRDGRAVVARRSGREAAARWSGLAASGREDRG